MRSATLFLACVIAATLHSAPRAASIAGGAHMPLTMMSARVSLDGTSNIRSFTASTPTVHLVVIEAGPVAGDVLDSVLQPGGLTALEVAIPAKGLTSPKEGVDKNMHKALRVEEFPNIRFRLRTMEPASGGYRAMGSLTIAGVERDVTLNLQAQRSGSALVVTATTDLLMTDYGIAPPTALMGMLKTDPKVEIRIELVLEAS